MIISIDKSLVLDMLENGRRISKRGLEEYRKIEVKTGVVKKAEGSAEVKIGNTRVIAGVKLDIGEPFDDTPEEGVLMVNAEFVPFASSEFEPGPPDENAIQLARVVDRAIREAKIFDNSQLVIEPGKAVWMVFIDIDIIDHDGNLVDASSLAALAALRSAVFPQYEKTEDGYKVLYDEPKTDEKLRIVRNPVSVTFGKIGKYTIVDPEKLEEDVLDGAVTFGVWEEGLSSVQSFKSCGFSPEELEELAEKAVEIGKKLRNFIV